MTATCQRIVLASRPTGPVTPDNFRLETVPAGRLRYRETVAEGLAAAPEAFIGMLRGRNFGKQLVKLA